MPRARPRPDWYLEVNPFGGVPAIRDGDLVLAESQAILRYLATRESRDDLYPTDPVARARVDWALDAWTTTVFPRIFPLYRALVAETRDEAGKPHPEQADPDRVEAELPGAREGFELLAVRRRRRHRRREWITIAVRLRDRYYWQFRFADQPQIDCPSRHGSTPRSRFDPARPRCPRQAEGRPSPAKCVTVQSRGDGIEWHMHPLRLMPDARARRRTPSRGL